MKLHVIFILVFSLVLLLVGGFVLAYIYSLANAFRPSSQGNSAYYPHPAITVHETSNPFLIWRVDGSFQVQFANGFVINEKTTADDLPKDWKIREDGMLKRTGTIVVDDEKGRHMFSANIERKHHFFIELDLHLYGSNATIVDLRTQKTVDLVDSLDTVAKVTEFFANAPR